MCSMIILNFINFILHIIHMLHHMNQFLTHQPWEQDCDHSQQVETPDVFDMPVVDIHIFFWKPCSTARATKANEYD